MIDYDWSVPDILNQIWYELTLKPDACLTEIILRWYNALYSALQPIDEFECCRPEDIQIDLPEELLDILLSVDLSLAQDPITEFLIQALVSLGKQSGKQILDDITSEVKKQLVEQTSPSV